MDNRTVANRTAGWEEKISQIRQLLLALERDVESFKNYCENSPTCPKCKAGLAHVAADCQDVVPK